MQPEITSAFGTPIISFDLPDAERVNNELREVIVARRAIASGVIRSNVAGWHSTDDLLKWGGQRAQQLATTFGQVCGAVTEFPQQEGAADVSWIVRMWANVSEGGAYNQPHHHPGAFWSGVYYVDDGGVNDDSSIGGQLILHNPHQALASMYAPDVHIKLPTGQRLSSIITVKPRPGRGIIFPSWLTHEVSPYQGKHTRISIALNFSVSPRCR